MPPNQASDEDDEERRRQTADAGGSAVDGAGGMADAAGSTRGSSGGSSGGSNCDLGCDGCDGPDCGCDMLLFLRLSTVLLLAAAVLPAVGCDGLVAALIRGYQRWLSRFTPACPGAPSCSAYALTAVRRLGARRGLAAAARRIESCQRPAS